MTPKVLDEDGNLLVTQKDRRRYNPVVAPAAEGKSFVIENGGIRLGIGTIAGGVFLTDGTVDESFAIDSGGRNHGPGFAWVPLCLARALKNHLVVWTTDNTLGRDGRGWAVVGGLRTTPGEARDAEPDRRSAADVEVIYS